MHNVLKAPEYLQYQLAFLSSVSITFVTIPSNRTENCPNLKELREIFAAAPAPVSSETSFEAPSNRKEVSGDCPICFTEFDPSTEDIVSLFVGAVTPQLRFRSKRSKMQDMCRIRNPRACVAAQIPC